MHGTVSGIHAVRDIEEMRAHDVAIRTTPLFANYDNGDGSLRLDPTGTVKFSIPSSGQFPRC